MLPLPIMLPVLASLYLMTEFESLKLFSFFLVYFITGCASMPQAANEPLTKYERIVDISDTSKEKIYEGSRQWFAKSFNDSNSVIKYEDAKTGSIIGKGSMQYNCVGGVLCAMQHKMIS